MVKLHLGCGKRFIPGFIHVDVLDYPHVDHRLPADNLSIFGDNSVDLIYACHLLEHFKRGDTEKVLREWHRILRPGGILRIAVPDFDKLVEVYQKYKDIGLILGPLCGRQDHEFNVHYNVFNFISLRALLLKVGFKIARKYDWKQTEHANVDDFSQAYIPHMDKENGILISLNVEAVK